MAGTGRQPRVLLIYTGGTIGMLPRDEGNPASPLVPRPFADSLAFNPGLEQSIRELGAGVDFEVERDVRSFDPPLDSAGMRPWHWVELARLIEAGLAGYDGVVVLHGTDTLAYTASALAFLLENLPKPVVLTGSQVPLFRSPSDARNNLLASIEIAAHGTPAIPLVPEVLIVFGDHVLRGCQATKVSASARNAFATLNGEPLGVIEPGRILIHRDRIRFVPDPAREPFRALYEMFDEALLRSRVIAIELTPDLHVADVRALLELPDVVGVLLHTYGAGNAPPEPELYELLARAAAAGCLIVNVSQCLHGHVEMGRYASSSELLECGVASGLDMTFESARIKVYWALATQRPDRRVAALQVGQRGEQTEDLVDLRFDVPAGGAASESWTASVLLDAAVHVDRLRQAVVRLTGVVFERFGDVEGSAPSVAVHLGDGEDADTRIAHLTGRWSDEPQTLVEEVTEGVERVGLGSRLALRIVCAAGVRIRVRGLFLAVFLRGQ